MAAAPPSSPESTRPPPRIVGRYALYGEIARGGMATVYFGRLLGPVGFSRTVAIKRLHPQYAGDAEFVAGFLDEARLAARVQHPNVVSTLDVVAMDGELMLVMEYVQGESLSRLLAALRARGERVPWRVVAALMNGILTGLHAAHEAKNERGEPLGIVHRDMSPQNVLVGSDGVVRVFDFGVAKAAGRAQDTRAGLFKGKLAYAAPEQLAGGPLDRRLDVYAASVVLWEIVTGRRMFKADDELQLYAMVKEGRIEPPSRIVPDLPAGLEAIVLRGLANDPAHRFATAREMAIALEEVLPHASPREVAEWVHHVAKTSLEHRARTIEEIETSNPIVDSGIHDLPTLLRSSLPPGSAPPTSAPSSLTGTYGAAVYSTAPAEPAPASNRRWVVAALLVVLVSASAGAAVAWLRPSSGPSVVEEPQTAAKAKPIETAAKELPEPDPEPVATSNAEPVAAPKPAPIVKPAAAKVAPAPASTKASAVVEPQPTSVAAKPTAAPAPNCNPPFTIDDEGIRHPKPECL